MKGLLCIALVDTSLMLKNFLEEKFSIVSAENDRMNAGEESAKAFILIRFPVTLSQQA